MDVMRTVRQPVPRMEGFLAIFDMLRALVHLRYMFVGLIGGAVLGLIYKSVVYGSFGSSPGTGSNAGDDVLVYATVLCAFVGLVLDIRRGLNNRR